MPETSSDQKLEQLLAYPETAQDDTFVMNVMHEVQREQRIRRIILWVFGLVGAMFGLASAAILSAPIARLFTFNVSMPAIETTQVALVIVAASAFYIWMMNDDFSLGD